MYPERSQFLSRRGVLLLAGAGLAGWTRLATASGDFWDKKAPSEWSSEEIDRLITKSPWAKEASATAPASQKRQNSSGGGYPQGGGYPGGGYPGGPRPGVGIPGMGYPRRRYPGGGGGGRPRGATYKGTVRWESAKPILDGIKTALPDAFANHYVIAVVGFPAPGNRRQDGEERAGTGRRMLDNIKQASSLQAKGRDRVDAGVVQQESGSSSFLIGFSKALLPLTAADKEVDFETRLGRLVIKAKFVPKEMKYHGELAL